MREFFGQLLGFIILYGGSGLWVVTWGRVFGPSTALVLLALAGYVLFGTLANWVYRVIVPPRARSDR